MKFFHSPAMAPCVGPDVQDHIELLSKVLRHAIPDARLIADSELNAFALMVCQKAGLLEIRPPDPNCHLRSGINLGPDNLLPPEAMNWLTELVRARVCAIKSGNPEIVLLADEPLRSLSHPPCLAPDVEAWLRTLQRNIARRNPDYASQAFEPFAQAMVTVLTLFGEVRQLQKGGRPVWHMTKRLKARLKREGR